MNKILWSKQKYKIESNNSIYGQFLMGPVKKGDAITIANTIRRTLLAELSGFAIVCVEIPGIPHEYSSITGVQESVVDILLNLKTINLICNQTLIKPVMGFLKTHGPGVVTAGDLKLPDYIKCVDANHYIATLSSHGCLEMTFMICKGKNFVIETSFPLLEAYFQSYFFCTDRKKQNIFSVPKKKNINNFNTQQIQNLINFKNLKTLENLIKYPNYRLGKKSILIKKQKTTISIQSVKHKSGLKLKKKNLTKFSTLLLRKKGTLTDKLTFNNLEEILVSQNYHSTTFQSFRNFFSQFLLKTTTNTKILLLDPVFTPITKVNYSIQKINKFYSIKNKQLQTEFCPSPDLEKISFEIWTNGTIDPEIALWQAYNQTLNMFKKFKYSYLAKLDN